MKVDKKGFRDSDDEGGMIDKLSSMSEEEGDAEEGEDELEEGEEVSPERQAAIE